MPSKRRAKKSHKPHRNKVKVIKGAPAPFTTVPTTKPETVLVMRHSAKDGSSRDGFVWPDAGPVECKDWKATKECGNGLHGWLWGSGDHGVSAFWSQEGARWLVVEVLATDIIDLSGKVKFPRGVVVHCGDQASATKFVADRLPPDLRGKVQILGHTVAVGDLGTASAGYRGTASAGDLGTASAGDLGTASAGDRGTASAGYRGTASAGYRGTASAGDLGTASAGYRGTASAGYRGTASAGDLGTASAGDRGTASAGKEGLLVIRYWDDKASRWRIAVGYPGENGVEAGKTYRVKDGALVESAPDQETEEARVYAATQSKLKPAERA
jgi:hypothetical protein